jgi:methionyl-tRNA formyltransferase
MTRLIFFGMTGRFSLLPLEKLFSGGINVAAVIIPADTPADAGLLGQPEGWPRQLEPPPAWGDLPVVNPYLNPNIIHLAWGQGVPVWQVKTLADSSTLARLAGFQPDLAVVACFPYKFPVALRQLPRYGCLNLHPSLLPAFRGPAPLYWQARQGVTQTGVTLHFLDEGLDSGDIVAQAAFDWPEGISIADMEQKCAEGGAQLLLEAIQQLNQTGQLLRQPQPQIGASYFSWPDEID